MNRVQLGGILTSVKVFDGKVKFCFGQIKTFEGSSQSITAFDKVVEKLAVAHEKKIPVLVEGKLKNNKQKDDSFKRDVVVYSVHNLIQEEEKSVLNSEHYKNLDTPEECPF